MGLALLGFFQAQPDLFPAGGSLKSQADQLLPHFIAAHLPPAVTGLVLSGLFAAAMSSIDSGVNSITAVVMRDFLDRLGHRTLTARQHLRTARGLAVAIGAIVVMLSTVMKHVPGNFLEVTNKTTNPLTVPIALLFLFALFVPFANAPGVWLATLASAVAAALAAFSGVLFGMDPVTGSDPISFQLIAPFSLMAGLAVGLVACKLFSLEAAQRQRKDERSSTLLVCDTIRLSIRKRTRHEKEQSPCPCTRWRNHPHMCARALHSRIRLPRRTSGLRLHLARPGAPADVVPRGAGAAGVLASVRH